MLAALAGTALAVGAPVPHLHRQRRDRTVDARDRQGFARRTGSTTVLWDYRGFGFSDGSPGIAATRDDALRVYDAMRARSRGELVLYGHSFGATIATRVATARPIRALVLHAAPSSATELLGAFRDRYLPPFMHRLRPIPTGAIREDFDLVREIRSVRAPTIVLHGTADATIPFPRGPRGRSRCRCPSEALRRAAGCAAPRDKLRHA